MACSAVTLLFKFMAFYDKQIQNYFHRHHVAIISQVSSVLVINWVTTMQCHA